MIQKMGSIVSVFQNRSSEFDYIPAIISVELDDHAIAKSHRSSIKEIFNYDRESKIIGFNNENELLVRIDSPKVVLDLGCIRSVDELQAVHLVTIACLIEYLTRRCSSINLRSDNKNIINFFFVDLGFDKYWKQPINFVETTETEQYLICGG